MIRADTALIEAARQGDRAALVKLLSVCQPDLKRFARRTCSNAEDAQDAVQIALWQLHRKVGALRTAAAFATWLFRIIERECWRLLRGRGNTESLDAQDSPALHMSAAPIPHDLRMDLARAMERLSQPYREVLLLRDVHEFTAAETAAQLDISVEAVKSRLHRARAMVREQLLACGYWAQDGLPKGKRDGL